MTEPSARRQDGLRHWLTAPGESPTNFMETANPLPSSAPDKAPEKPTEITSLAQLAGWHNEPIGVTVNLYGRTVHFTGRRLTPSETAEVKALLEKAIPPRKENGEYDFDAPQFLSERVANKSQARAKCLWLAFPKLFTEAAKAQAADVGDLKKLAAFVDSQALADEVLEALFGTAIASPVSIVELTGFTSGSNSPKS